MDVQPSDLVFLAIVIWVVIELTGGGGGGLRDRTPALSRAA
jgi:hypothetical protein